MKVETEKFIIDKDQNYVYNGNSFWLLINPKSKKQLVIDWRENRAKFYFFDSFTELIESAIKEKQCS